MLESLLNSLASCLLHLQRASKGSRSFKRKVDFTLCSSLCTLFIGPNCIENFQEQRKPPEYLFHRSFWEDDSSMLYPTVCRA